MEIKLIKYMCIVENIFCIHRNWKFSRKFDYVQLLILIFVAYESTVLILCFISSFSPDYFELTTYKLYRFTNNMFSIIQIMWAFLRSGAFKEFVEYLNICHSRCAHDLSYQRGLRKTQTVTMTFCITIAVSLAMIVVQNHGLNHGGFPPVAIIIYQLNGATCAYRFLLEFFVLFGYLSIISHQLAFMIESVDKRKMNDVEAMEIEEQEVFNEWCILYGDIVKCSKLFNEVFGTQIAFMLMTMASFYILFLYSIFSLGIIGQLSTVGLMYYISGTSFMLFELAMLLHKAQQVRHNAEVLRRRLCKQLVHYFDKEYYYRPVKDFLRLMSTRPIEFQTLGSVSVDMSLLPSSFIFFIYNTVIALQFNNVL